MPVLGVWSLYDAARGVLSNGAVRTSHWGTMPGVCEESGDDQEEATYVRWCWCWCGLCVVSFGDA